MASAAMSINNEDSMCKLFKCMHLDNHIDFQEKENNPLYSHGL
jgi:hypothetical protein